ncbi:MAG: type II toxin-antitoxin system RelE/ParE family toxin [Pseudomonadota bacterium]
MRIDWSERATLDLARIQAFNLSRSDAFAARVERRLFERVATLGRLPHQGLRIAGSNVRKLSIPDIQYVVTYRSMPDLIVIMGVRSTREVQNDGDLLR